MLSLGLLYGYATGYAVGAWRLITGMMAVPSVVLFAATLFVAESPYQLVEKGKLEEAEATLRLFSCK